MAWTQQTDESGQPIWYQWDDYGNFYQSYTDPTQTAAQTQAPALLDPNTITQWNLDSDKNRFSLADAAGNQFTYDPNTDKFNTGQSVYDFLPELKGKDLTGVMKNPDNYLMNALRWYTAAVQDLANDPNIDNPWLKTYFPNATPEELRSTAWWATKAPMTALGMAERAGDAERDRQAAADKGGGIGGLGLALGIAAMIFAPAATGFIADALGISSAAAGAVYGGATAAATGGNIATGALMGGIGAGFGGGGGVDSQYLAAADAAGGMVPEFGTNAAYSSGLAGATPSVPEGGSPSLYAGNTGRPDVTPQPYDVTQTPGTWELSPPWSRDMPGTWEQTPPDIQPPATSSGTPFTPSAENYAQAYPGGGDFTQAPPPQGIIERIFDKLLGAPPIAAAAITAAGGLAGGVATGLFTKSATEAKIQAEKDLQAQKTQNQMELEDWKRRHLQGAGTWRLPFGPSRQPLQHLSTGNPFYNPRGLIARRMGG